jgi:hypothetical protein
MMLSPEMRDLALQLLDQEVVSGQTSESAPTAMVRLSEKLRRSLSAVVGVADYRMLVSRALTLAKEEAPILNSIQVTADGALLGATEREPQNDKNDAGHGEVIFIAQLLGLFLALVGAVLTLRLVQDIAPQLEVTTKSNPAPPFENILDEVTKLNSVSERLELLADGHSCVEDALLSVAGNLRITANSLEVLVLIRDMSKATVKSPSGQSIRRYLM